MTRRLALALLVLALFAATAANVTAAERTIRYMTFLPAEIEAEVVAAFEAAHPDIDVELEPVGFGEIFDRLRVSVVGGVAPDVVSLNLENYTEFSSGGALLNLDDRIARDGYDLGQYYPQVLELFRLNGSFYAMPASFSDVVLFYNEDLYNAAGITGPDMTWSWNDMLSAARKLTKDTSNDGVADQFGYVTAWWPMYVWLGGGRIFDETGTKSLINSPEAERGLQEMVDTWLVHGVAPSPSQLAERGDWDRWSDGTLATFPIGPWGLAPFQDTSFDWNAAHHPPIAERATFLFSNPLAVTSQSTDPDAAWEFVKFATGPEGTEIRQGAGYEISPVRSVAESSFGQGLARPKDMRVFLEATQYAKAPPRIPAWNEVHAAIDQELNRARVGEISVKNALANAHTAVQAILDRQ